MANCVQSGQNSCEFLRISSPEKVFYSLPLLIMLPRCTLISGEASWQIIFRISENVISEILTWKIRNITVRKILKYKQLHGKSYPKKFFLKFEHCRICRSDIRNAFRICYDTSPYRRTQPSREILACRADYVC